MLEADSVRRYSANYCRYHFDSLHLPDELGTHQELQSPHKRNADLAGLDVPNASRRFRRNSEQSTAAPVLDS
ncbi:hypothetical protein BDZ45DRAFT_220715 [Acephala macrosclerotiorum]|nr:hypothetical protein BDZ45DRAFT_220715 [Acephala macrosclerotiorum]